MATQVRLDGVRQPNLTLKSGVGYAYCGGVGDSYEGEGRALSGWFPAKKSSRKQETLALLACEGSGTGRREGSARSSSGSSTISSSMPSNMTCRSRRRRGNDRISTNKSRSTVCSGNSLKQQDSKRDCSLGSRNTSFLDSGANAARSSVRIKGRLGERGGSGKCRWLMCRYRSKEEARKAVFAGIAAWGGLGRQQVSTAGNGVAPLKISMLKRQVGVLHASRGPPATAKSQQSMLRSSTTRAKAALAGGASPASCLIRAGSATPSTAAAVLRRHNGAAVAASDNSKLAAVQWQTKLAPVNTEGEGEGQREDGKREYRRKEEAVKQNQAAQQAPKDNRRSEKEAVAELALSRPVTTGGGGKLSAHAAVGRGVGVAAAGGPDKGGPAELQIPRKNVAGGRDTVPVTAQVGENSTSVTCSVSVSGRQVVERSPSACLSTSSTSHRRGGSSDFGSTTSSTTSSSSASSIGWFGFSSSRSGSRSSSRSRSGNISESTQSSMRSSASVSSLFDSSAGTSVSSSSTSSPAVVSPRQNTPLYVSPFSAALLGSSSSSSPSSCVTPFSFSSPRSSRVPSSRPSEGMRTPPRVSASASSPLRLAAAGGKFRRVSYPAKCSAATHVCAGKLPLSNKDRTRSGESPPQFLKGLPPSKTKRHAVEEKSTVSKELMHAFTRASIAPGKGIKALHSRRRAPFLSRFRGCAIAGAEAVNDITLSLEKRNSSVRVARVLSQQLLSTPHSAASAASERGGTSGLSPTSERLSWLSCSSSAGAVRANSASEASPSLMHVVGASTAAAALPACEKTGQFSGPGHTRRRQLEGRKLSAKEGSNGREERKLAVNAGSNTEKSLSSLGNDNKSVQGCSSFLKKTNRSGSEKASRVTLGAAASERASDAMERQGRRNRVGGVRVGGDTAGIRGGVFHENTQMQNKKHGGTTSKGRRQQKWKRGDGESEQSWSSSSSSGSVVSTDSCLADQGGKNEPEEERHERQPQQEGSFSALRAAGGLLKRFSFSSPTEDHIPTVSPLKRMLKSFLSTSSSSSSSSSTDGECAVEPLGRPRCPIAAECRGAAETVSLYEQGRFKSAGLSGEKSFSSYSILRNGTLGGDRIEGRSEKRRGGGVEADVAERVYPRLKSLPMELLQSVLQCLTVEEILRLQAVCTDFYTAVREKGETFAYIRRLKLDRKWACMDVTERQEMLLQMQRLRHILVSSNAFTGGSITIQEVAALVYRNADTLRYLCLHSPENPLHDETPLHAPFAFRPLPFPRLRVFTLAGCQALEWAHVFSNCCLPSVERFEITYFPVQSDHWSWQVLPDFTALGLSGLQRMLNSMPTLERFTIGLEVRHEEDTSRPGWDFDIVDPEVDFFHDWPGTPDRLDGRRLRSEEAYQISERPISVNESASSNSARRSHIVAPVASHGTSGYGSGRAGGIGVEAGRYWVAVLDEEEERRRFTGVDPVGGRGRLKSWRGKISEEDFADLCAVAFVRAGAAGSLKRIIIKHRVKAENEESSFVNVSTLSDIFQGAASFCYRFVSDVFTGFPGTRR